MLVKGCLAQMAELVDALGSGPSESNLMEVRVFFWAPSCKDVSCSELKRPKHTWIAASKHQFLLAMTNKSVIAKAQPAATHWAKNRYIGKHVSSPICAGLRFSVCPDRQSCAGLFFFFCCFFLFRRAKGILYHP